MPARDAAPQHLLAAYHSPAAFPAAVWNAFRRHERAANIMYPHALKSLHREAIGPPDDLPVARHLWLTLSTRPSPDAEAEIEIVLSCTAWAMGDYPVFIFSTVPFESLSMTWAHPRSVLLAQELLKHAPVQRVFSVFGPATIAKTFAQVWHFLTDMPLISEPYYAASFTYCTLSTLRPLRHATIPRGTRLRRAEERDVLQVAALCKGFASTSEPFVLDDAGSLKEAIELIRNKVLWVHEAFLDGQRGIASMVATTRQSENVTGITKVYTNPRYRRMGCAERLVSHVCQQALMMEGKESVVLYVAHDNRAAVRCYDRVGFLGLADKPKVEGVDPWIEIGFAGAEIGHW